MITIDTSGIIKRKLRPFNAANRDDFSMYNKLPYFRDIDLCTQEMITLVTGNVIKYFECKIEETLPLCGIDTLALLKIKEYENRERLRLQSFPSESEAISISVKAIEMNEENNTLIDDHLNGDTSTINEDTKEKKQRPAYLDLDFE
ncbi:MAG: hypothetical protein ACERKN_01510 [Velocimicrobium sp.]